MFVVDVFNCTVCVYFFFLSLSLLLSGFAALMRNEVYIIFVLSSTFPSTFVLYGSITPP